MVDERTYIKVHDGMPDHPKVEPLSDKAFRLLVDTWCWCSRHLTDGRVPRASWDKRSTPKARRELVAAGLAEVTDSHVQMHDYLDHQRARQEVDDLRAKKKRAGRLGNHQRWHTAAGVYDPECEFCQETAPPEPPPSDEDGPPIRNGSHPGSQVRSQNGRETSPESETETKNRSTRPGISGAGSNAHARAIAATARSHRADVLVNAYAATRNHRPSAKIRTRLAQEVGDLLAENWPDDLITASLTAWGDKGLDPAALQSVANEVANRAPRRGRESTTDAAVAAVQALKQPAQHALPPGGRP